MRSDATLLISIPYLPLSLDACHGTLLSTRYLLIRPTAHFACLSRILIRSILRLSLPKIEGEHVTRWYVVQKVHSTLGRDLRWPCRSHLTSFYQLKTNSSGIRLHDECSRPGGEGQAFRLLPCDFAIACPSVAIHMRMPTELWVDAAVPLFINSDCRLHQALRSCISRHPRRREACLPSANGDVSCSVRYRRPCEPGSSPTCNPERDRKHFETSRLLCKCAPRMEGISHCAARYAVSITRSTSERL